jgi:hypothetical protein
MTAGFQRTVNLQQAAAVAGDFASANPRASVVGHEGTLVAGATGVTVARFGWASAAGLVSNTGQSAPTGFVHRRQGSALITTYLGETSNLIPQGFEVTLMLSGDYWVAPTAQVTVGQKVFANLGDGTILGGAAGATIAGFVGTASFATNVMTVTVVTSGTVDVNDVVTSAGVASGTYVTAQLTGTPGGVGTYSLSTSPGTITAQAVTTTSHVETQFTITGFPVGGTGAVGELAVMSRPA